MGDANSAVDVDDLEMTAGLALQRIFAFDISPQEYFDAPMTYAGYVLHRKTVYADVASGGEKMGQDTDGIDMMLFGIEVAQHELPEDWQFQEEEFEAFRETGQEAVLTFNRSK